MARECLLKERHLTGKLMGRLGIKASVLKVIVL